MAVGQNAGWVGSGRVALCCDAGETWAMPCAGLPSPQVLAFLWPLNQRGRVVVLPHS
jgi:hypothetical protein